VLVAAFPPRGGEGFKERTRWDWFPLMCGLLAVGAGIFFGIVNSAVLEPWLHVHYLRSYDNVAADADPRIYSDGGILHFASGTKLDTGSSAGHLSWPYTYCAAPIVKDGAAADASVGFWAVGVNCCNAHGEFTCDDASDTSARSGLRIESHAMSETAGDNADNKFASAVNKAAAFYGKTVSQSPVYVVWNKDPKQKGTVALISAAASLVVLLVAATCGCYASRSLLRKVHTPPIQGRGPRRLVGP